MWRLATMAILAAGLLGPLPGRAADADLFEGLIPGTPLSHEEMGEVFGRGAFTFGLVNGVVTLDGIAVDQNQVSTVSQTSGITNTVPVIGDNNTVNVLVNVEVNLNTVTVTDSAGASVSVNQSLDFGGGVIQALGQ